MSQKENLISDAYSFSFLNTNIIITEMLDESLEEPTKANQSEFKSSEIKKYFVEEPLDQFDYIFEPEHYKTPKEPVNETNLNEVKNSENKFTHARVVSETDGFLEYEYKSYTYFNKNSSDKSRFSSSDDDEEFEILCHNHLDAIIRGEIMI